MYMTRLISALILALPLSATAFAETDPLPLGKSEQGQASPDEPRVYSVTVDGPGILTVAVRSGNGEDLGINIADAHGQTLANGYGDIDEFGILGDEQLASTLGSAGDYLVYISAYDQHATYTIGASYLPMAEAELPEDPLGAPDTASPLKPGQKMGDTIRPARGDHYDWYRVTPEHNGVLTVYTRGAEDVILEAYQEGEYHDSLATADGTDQTAMGNESITLDVRENEPVYFRVSTYSTAADYTINAGMVGE